MSRQNCNQLKNRKPPTMPVHLAAMTTSAVYGVGPSSPKARTSLQQRQRQSSSAAARRACAQSEQPRQWGFMPRLRLGKLTEEGLRLGRPKTTSLHKPTQQTLLCRGDQSTQDTPTLSVGGHATEPLHPQLGCALAVCRHASAVKHGWCPGRVALH